MSERTIRADGFELATQSFGNPAHPPVLPVMGGMASMLWWPDTFCRRLAARGRFAIRYDQRDTGLSSKFPPDARLLRGRGRRRVSPAGRLAVVRLRP
jgi:pimeloyl-ACP methyl ester carboxylesterase